MSHIWIGILQSAPEFQMTLESLFTGPEFWHKGAKSQPVERDAYVTLIEGQDYPGQSDCPLVKNYLFLGRWVIWTTLNF